MPPLHKVIRLVRSDRLPGNGLCIFSITNLPRPRKTDPFRTFTFTPAAYAEFRQSPRAV